MTDGALSFEDMFFYSYPMHQQYIDNHPLYVSGESDFDGYLPGNITMHFVNSGDILSQKAFFYYPGEIRDFKIYDLQYNFAIEGYQITDTVFQKDSLTKDEAVLWSGYSGDIYSNLGFSFIDGDGNTREFIVSWTMKDNSIHDPYTIHEQKLFSN